MVTGTGGKEVRSLGFGDTLLAYDYAYEGAVRVASGNGLPRQQGS